MDLSKVKNGNDFLAQMFAENETADNAPEKVIDNAGANAAAVETDTELDVINDEGSDAGDGGNANPTLVDENKATDDFIDNWDDTVVDAPEAPKFDFKELGKALEIEGIETKEALVTKVKEIVQKSKELEQKAATFSSIPEPLQEAIELANKGGDYLEYLGVSTIDYDSIDDRTLVEDELISYGLFKKADGSVDEDALAEHVDGLNDKEVLVRAAQVRARYKQEQDIQRQTIKQKAEQRKAQAVNELRSALDKLEAVGPFKLKPAHKKDMYDTFVAGQMMKELFHNNEGKFDFNKALRIYFKEKYSDKIDKLVTEAVRNQTIKQKVSDIKNVDLQSPSRIARPDVPSAADPLDMYMRKLQGLK